LEKVASFKTEQFDSVEGMQRNAHSYNTVAREQHTGIGEVQSLLSSISFSDDYPGSLR
jgi:hypothetical protein